MSSLTEALRHGDGRWGGVNWKTKMGRRDTFQGTFPETNCFIRLKRAPRASDIA